MPKPTKDQVRNEVIRIISTFTPLEPSGIKESHVLRDPPLYLDDIGLAFLAESLRGYVKQYVPSASVTAAETRKSGLTVGAVVALLQTKAEAV